MKTRAGFVSNSSSSSFIMGLAIIPDDQVSKYKKRNVFQYLKDELPYPIREKVRQEDSELSIESFTYRTVQVKAKPGDWILWLDAVGINGDEHFWKDDDYYDYDDIDISDFDDSDVEIYNEIFKISPQVLYGAGRDG